MKPWLSTRAKECQSLPAGTRLSTTNAPSFQFQLASADGRMKIGAATAGLD